MRRWLIGLAAGLLWAGVASAQPDGYLEDEHAVSQVVIACGVIQQSHICHDWEALEEKGPEALLHHLAPALNVGPGKNTDSSCLPDVARCKSRLCWENQFPVFDYRGCLKPPPPPADGCDCLEILKHLYFLDAPPPLTLTGPDMGPLFKEDTMVKWVFCT